MARGAIGSRHHLTFGPCCCSARGPFFRQITGGRYAARSRSSSSAANSRQRARPGSSWGRRGSGGSAGSTTTGHCQGRCGTNFASRLCSADQHSQPAHCLCSQYFFGGGLHVHVMPSICANKIDGRVRQRRAAPAPRERNSIGHHDVYLASQSHRSVGGLPPSPA